MRNGPGAPKRPEAVPHPLIPASPRYFFPDFFAADLSGS